MNSSRVMSLLVPPVEGDAKAYITILCALAALVLIGVLLRIIIPTSIPARYLMRTFIVGGIAGILVYTFRLEGVLYFDSNLWIWLLYSVLGLGILWSLIIRFTKAPRVYAERHRREIQSRYIPHSKKKYELKKQ